MMLVQFILPFLQAIKAQLVLIHCKLRVQPFEIGLDHSGEGNLLKE
jgi:hypothetical protein